MRLLVWWTRAAQIAGAFGLLAGLWWILNRDTPLLDSPLTAYLRALGIAGLFLVACLSSGLRLVRWLLPGRVAIEARLALAAGLGALAFFYATFLLGLCGLLKFWPALLMAVALVVSGLREGWRVARPRLAAPHRAPRARRFPLLTGVGVLVLGCLAIHPLTASSIGYDSSWYHVPVAEAYAATGAIRPFRDGWILGAYPQLSSVLYAWALVLTPSAAIGLTSAAFIELCFVLIGIGTIVPLLRALLGGRERVHWGWATVALFPAVILYPPRLEADYVAAAFGGALLVSAFKVWERADTRNTLVGALLLAGLLLVKYSALSAVAFPVALAFAGLVRRLWRARKQGFSLEARGTAATLGLATLTFLAASTPHWLKNWGFYGDPLFPRSTPASAFSPTAHAFYEAVLKTLWVPAQGWEGWKETFKALFTYSFEPHEYVEHNAGHPVVGSLFSLTLPALLLLLPLARARRALATHIGALVGVLVWYRLHHQDRYLLVLLPWMCAVTAATLRLLWSNWVARLAVAAAVVVQLAWGARWAAKELPLSAVTRALWATSVQAWEADQLARWHVLHRVGRAIPRDGVVLIHEERIRLGLRRASVSDSLGFQTQLSCGDLGTDARIYDRLTSLGVTHLYASTRSGGFVTLADDLTYHAFFLRYGGATREPELRTMPKQRPPEGVADARLAFIDVCDRVRIESGLYPVQGIRDVTYGMPLYLTVAPIERARGADMAALVGRAEFAIVADGCSASERLVTSGGFERMTSRDGYGLYFKRAAR